MPTCLERNSVHWNTELTVAGFGWWHLVEVGVFPAAARRSPQTTRGGEG